MKSLKQKCWLLCKKIPHGQVTTYGEIARALKISPRVVGRAMRASPGMPKVPCHRVIRSDGKIGGFNKGIKEKIKLLRKEGVKTKFR